MAEAIKPSDLKNWDDIDQSKANLECCAGLPKKHPEWYDWYEHESGIFYPHRKPTISEMHNDEFH